MTESPDIARVMTSYRCEITHESDETEVRWIDGQSADEITRQLCALYPGAVHINVESIGGVH